MAHIAKYKATSVGHMLAHYRRDASSLERDNIDPKRVKNDMVVAHYTNKDGQLVVGRVVPREGRAELGHHAPAPMSLSGSWRSRITARFSCANI